MSADARFPQTRWQRERLRRDPHDHFVYIIGHVDGANELAGPVKVGLSVNPLARMQQLQTGSAHRLVLMARHAFWLRRHAEIVERSFHDALSVYRLEGEWFDLRPQTAIAAMQTILVSFIRQYLQPDDVSDYLDACDQIGVANGDHLFGVELRFPS